MDSLTTFSWRWKIKNTQSADGIFIRFFSDKTPIFTIGSHTNYTFADLLNCEEKGGVWNEHKINIPDVFLKQIKRRRVLNKPITQVKFVAVDAIEQGLWIDYISFSREAAHFSDKVINYRFIKNKPTLMFSSKPISACLADIDRDNDLDLYIINQKAQNYLRLNNGQGKFSEPLLLHKILNRGKNCHAIFVDINDDGWPDLFEARENAVNQLFGNNGNLNFEAVQTFNDSLNCFTQTYATLWADFDHNNSLDFIEIYPSLSINDYSIIKTNACINFFNPAGKKSIAFQAPYFGGSVSDYNNDDKYEIFLADNRQENHLFQLQDDHSLQLVNNTVFKDHPFPHRLDNKNKGYGWSEGSVFLDIDNDGDLDLYVGNDGDPNQLYIWKENKFSEEAHIHYLDDSLKSEGFLVADFDNDMDWDIYLLHSKKPNQLMLNDGRGYFYDGTTASGFEHPGGSVGGACGDVDNDGDIDVYLVDPYKGEQLLINPINNNNYLKLKLRGQPGNYYGIRAKLWLFQGDSLNDASLVCHHQLTCGDGFQFEAFARQFHFGLNPGINYSIKIVFDDKTEIINKHIRAGRTITIIYPYSNFILTSYKTFLYQVREPFLIWLRTVNLIFSLLILALLGLIGNYAKQLFIIRNLKKHAFAAALITLVTLFMADLKIVSFWQILAILVSTVYFSELIINPIRKFLHKHYVRESSWDGLYGRLKAFRHGGVALNNLDRLIFLFQNLKDFEGNFTIYRNRIADAMRTYNKQTSWQLTELVYVLKDVHWDRNSIKIIQKNQNQLLQLSGLLLRLDTHRAIFINNINAVLTKIKNIENSIGQISSQIEHRFTCEPSAIIMQTVNTKYPKMNCEINSALTQETIVKIKGYELGNIIADLIENGIRSLPENISYEGKIDLQQEDSIIIIDITDNGKGIPKTFQNKIFEKGFTTRKTDGGFGLYYAKETLVKYGGSISIFKTAKNMGTTMRLKLRVVSKR